jgi:hypothetical protein
LTVGFTVGGTAASGSDYAPLGTSVTFAAGATTANKIVDPVADDLEEGTETVVVTIASGAGYVAGIPSSATVTIADTRNSGVEWIVDDADPSAVTLTGDWTSSASNPGYWASGYRHDGNTGKGAKAIRFTPALPAGSARYDVFIWYTSGANRARNVPVEIAHADGTSTVVVNQILNGSTWVPLGTYTLSAAQASVTIRNTDTTGFVVADAIRFVARSSEVAELTWSLDLVDESLNLRWPAVAGSEYIVHGVQRLGETWREVGRVTSNGPEQSYTVPIAGSNTGFFKVVENGPK